MRPCATLLRGRPPALAALAGPPDDVPLAALSTRSLMDRCMGRGAWKRARAPPLATSLADLPRLDTHHAPPMLAELAARAIPATDFVAWYNVLTRASWADSAALLDTLAPVPPFVLQRALARADGVADAASAVHVATRHSAAYTADNAARVAARVLDATLARRAWHTARPATQLALRAAHAWLARRQPQPERAQALVQHAAALLLAADDDARARDALLAAIAFAHTHVPAAAAWIAQHAVRLAQPRTGRHPRRRRAADWVVDAAVVDALLADAPPALTSGLCALGVRVAALRRDTERARTYYARLHPDARPTDAFLRALAHSPHHGDVHAAWALFDAMQAADGAPVPAVPAVRRVRLADWMLMLRAAAGDRRIPARRVLALLQLYETPTPGDAQHAWAQWRVPHDIGEQIAHARIAYASAVDGFLARGDVVRALRVWRASLRRGVAPDAALLTSVCKAHLRRGHAARALREVARWCYEGVALAPGERGWMWVGGPAEGGGGAAERPASDAAAEQPAPGAPAERPASDAPGVWPASDPTDAASGAAPAASDAAPAASDAVSAPRPLDTHDTPARPPVRHRVQATTYLANTLLEGLLHLGSHQTLFQVWRALGPALHVRPDVVSLDLVLRAARREVEAARARGAAAGAAAPTEPDAGAASGLLPAYAACAFVQRVLQTQHPELATCRSALDAASHSWLLRGEQRLRRWERWLAARVAALFARAPPGDAEVPAAPAPLTLDARVLHRYAELLAALLDVGGGRALAEELFRLPAYLARLDLAPERDTLCLLYCVQDTQLPPGVAQARTQTPLHAELEAWLGAAALPTDDEIGAFFRAQQRRS
ncbi:hypothetical protein CBS9595_004082 [Malassezia furfur]|nr:hypothetical protein CBS9595_004082 [Malassezia furfur]